MSRPAMGNKTLSLSFHWLIGFAVNLAFGGAAYLSKGVDTRGFVSGVVVGTAIYGGLGLPGFGVLALFFILGTGATRLGRRLKEAEGVAETKGGRRTTRHVLANGLVAGLCGLGAAFFPTQREAFGTAFAGALAAATADTLAGEIGQVFGGTPYFLTTFRPVRVGENGGVTLVGTIAGAGGALLIGLVAWYGGIVTRSGTVVLAGIAGNLIDSLMGATLERRGTLNNTGVNFSCTLSGALVAYLLATQ